MAVRPPSYHGVMMAWRLFGQALCPHFGTRRPITITATDLPHARHRGSIAAARRSLALWTARRREQATSEQPPPRTTARLDYRPRLPASVVVTADYYAADRVAMDWAFSLALPSDAAGRRGAAGARSANSERRSADTIDEVGCIGIELRLAPELDTLDYFGRGSHENSVDRLVSADIGLYRARVSDIAMPYVRPQEFGVHCDCQWLSLHDGAGHGIIFVAADRFLFHVSCFDPADYDRDGQKRQRHSGDLPRRPYVYLRLMTAQRGVGGIDTWGYEPLSEYRLRLPQQRALRLVTAAHDMHDADQQAEFAAQIRAQATPTR